MRNIIAGFLVLIFFTGCQQAPTKVYESQPVSPKSADSHEIAITEKTVILDARPAFEYTVAHLNGSIQLHPDEFTQNESPFLGLLEADHFALARRLARLGIAPETPVVVVGKGPKGTAEEGQLAWILRYLGVKDVKYAAIDYFSLPLSTAEAPPHQNEVIWKPQENESLEVSKQNFIKELKTAKTATDAAVIIDARAANEYLADSKDKKHLEIGAINIPWTEFLTAKGLPNEAIKARLESIGITANRKIYVIANKGVESALVTLVLRDLGYEKAANFSGGYLQLLSKKSK
jgi:thiosulfate/3-mercaptopyruvate sulfurtransferase